MKRSEMILKIAECLIEPHYEDPFEEAGFILKKLESVGMSPPGYMKKHGPDDGILRTYWEEAWEPEDE